MGNNSVEKNEEDFLKNSYQYNNVKKRLIVMKLNLITNLLLNQP